MVTIRCCQLLFGWLAILIFCLARWGWVGSASWIGVTFASLFIVHVLYRYTDEAAFELDSVPCAVCGRFLKFDFEGVSRGGRWDCECGAQYRLKGPTLYLLNESGSLRPHMRWKWWGKGVWRRLSPG